MRASVNSVLTIHYCTTVMLLNTLAKRSGHELPVNRECVVLMLCEANVSSLACALAKPYLLTTQDIVSGAVCICS